MSESEYLPAPINEGGLPARVDHVSGTLALIQSAINKGIDPEALGKLLDLQDRVIAKQAASEFTLALKGFQSECPIIGKNKDGHNYRYADLDKIITVIRPLLDKYGLSYSFDSDVTETNVAVTCTICHVSGHSKQTRFAAPIDPNAKGMSATQKFASVTTYGRRYSLVMSLGIVVAEEDRDAAEEFDAPEQKKGAPKPAPRNERNQRPPDDEPPADNGQPVVTEKMVKAVVDEWKLQQQGTPDPSAYAAWVVATTGRTFNSRRASEWTWTDFVACCKVLGVPTE